MDGPNEMNGSVKEDAGTEEETFLSSNPVSHVEHETSV